MEPAKGFENQWRNWFGTLYETYYCELACEALVSRWESILTSGLERTVKERLDGILKRKEYTK